MGLTRPQMGKIYRGTIRVETPGPVVECPYPWTLTRTVRTDSQSEEGARLYVRQSAILKYVSKVLCL